MASDSDLKDFGVDDEQRFPYVCVHCGTPCAALYRRLNVSTSSSTIQAMTCTNCGKLVDPYTEQEWLLVAIDCILMREEAYRHVLYNVDELKRMGILTMTQCLLGWSILDAYLRTVLATEPSQPANTKDTLSLGLFGSAVLTSALVVVIQCGLLNLMHQQELPGAKLFWALLLPLSFSIVTVFVRIWEDSSTVRTLGSLLTAYWQWLAVGLVTKNRATTILGLLGGILLRSILFSVLLYESYPCVGIELDLFKESPWHQICIG